MVFEAAIEAGANDVTEADDDAFEITCPMEEFSTVRDAITTSLGDPLEAKVIWNPLNTIACDEDAARSLFKMIDALDNNDDVQNVYANFEISDDIATKLAD